MHGYTSSTYGDAFADVYDDWYAALGDAQAWRDLVLATIPDALAALPLLELGIGTGRLAIPLAEAGRTVVGVDTSAAMLERIPERTGSGHIDARLGDMVDDLPPGPFSVAFCGFNTLFNLLSAERQAACVRAVASRLAPGGAWVLETAVAEAPGDAGGGEADDLDTGGAATADGRGGSVELRSMNATQVVLSVSRADPARQIAEGQFIEFSADGAVRLRPWTIRWSTLGELDAMAERAGLVLSERFGDTARTPFDASQPRHVSIYRRPT